MILSTSAVYITKRRAPSTDPCGTLQVWPTWHLSPPLPMDELCMPFNVGFKPTELYS